MEQRFGCRTSMCRALTKHVTMYGERLPIPHADRREWSVSDARSHLSRAQQVAVEVENEILDAHIPVGASLGRRTDLMKRFAVSPTVINEALRILRDRGLVAVKPGPGGGVSVASRPPQVRLGAIDLWFTGAGSDPLDLFEARMHLEETLTRVAVDRAGPSDIRDMEWALESMRSADDPRAYLEANMRLHLAVARAARIPILTGMYEAIIAIISGTLTRAAVIADHEEMYAHNLAVHTEIVAAIRDGNREALEKLMGLHGQDLVRAVDPSRSPGTTD
jgi:DNA-binding FadR family transcriptional regulator